MFTYQIIIMLETSTPNSSIKGSGANHYPAPALKACVSYQIKSYLFKIVFCEQYKH